MTPAAHRVALAEALEERLTRSAEQSLHAFVRQAWPVAEPQTPFVDNWHIGALAEHLQAVAYGQIDNLGINVPPSTGKSTIVSVCFPAWVWARQPLAGARLGPGMRFMTAAYDQTQSTRDTMRTRDVLLSAWYQSRWPVRLRQDLNLKTRFGNLHGGWRLGLSVGAPRMGEHPNYKLIDDPHNPKKQLLSDAEIQQACDWYDYSLKTRGQMIGAATVLVMQRLHEKDLCGHVREKEGGQWTWLVLPMRWEPKRMAQVPPLCWRDPRDPGAPAVAGVARGEGALLWPTQWTARRVVETYAPGSWGDAGQFQQRPAPTAGLMFKRDWFRVTHEWPANVAQEVRSWDAAATEGGTGARSAGVRMALTADGKFVVRHVVKGRWEDVGLHMRATAELDGPSVWVSEEQEPGGSGKAVTIARRKLLRGYAYQAISKRVDKRVAAGPLRTSAEAGDVLLYVPLDASGAPDATAAQMMQEFLDEITLFPAGSLKDQVDAASQAHSVLNGVVGEDMGLVTGARPSSELSAEQMLAREQVAREQAARAVTDEIRRSGVYWPGGR